MTATKKSTKITDATRATLTKVAHALWDLGVCHPYGSQWMKNPLSEHYICPCGERGTGLSMGFVQVSFDLDAVGQVFVQVLMPEQKTKCFIPSLDFPGW